MPDGVPDDRTLYWPPLLESVELCEVVEALGFLYFPSPWLAVATVLPRIGDVLVVVVVVVVLLLFSFSRYARAPAPAPPPRAAVVAPIFAPVWLSSRAEAGNCSYESVVREVVLGCCCCC